MAALWLVCSAVGVSAQEPKVRTSFETGGDFWVGQRAVLIVELLAPGFFSGTPSFNLPDPQGMLLVPATESPVVSSEGDYTVQRHEVSVFARRAGVGTIPSFTVRFRFKRNPLDKDSVSAVVKTEPIQFRAKLPPGAEKLGSVISARNLKGEERWKPEPGKAKPGDAFTRTITFTAPDVPAMAFPPFLVEKIDGIGIYRKTPEVVDHSERGEFSGERQETITYVCERPGQFVIPVAQFTWWDLDALQLRTVDFPARTLNVAGAPASKENPRDHRALVIVFLGAGLIAAIIWKYRAILRPVHLVPLNPNSQL